MADLFGSNMPFGVTKNTANETSGRHDGVDPSCVDMADLLGSNMPLGVTDNTVNETICLTAVIAHGDEPCGVDNDKLEHVASS